MKQVSYSELPVEIQKCWREKNVAKAFYSDDSLTGKPEYTIVPVDETLPVEWWNQRKTFDGWGWAWNGSYGRVRPEWA